MLDLLLQTQNLLREQIDLGVLLVDLFAQAEEFRVSETLPGPEPELWAWARAGGGSRRKRERENAAKANHGASLAFPSDAGKRARGLRFGGMQR